MASTTAPRESLWVVVLGDGRPALFAVAASLVFAGGFAMFVAGSGLLLPHDVAHLGMDAGELAAVAGERVVAFMVHDRVAWGGSVAAVGVLYVWLAAFPLAHGEGWAWWTLAVSGAVGFATFLLYLDSGYLDTWHGTGTLLLLPVFWTGVARSRGLLRGDRSWRSLLRPAAEPWHLGRVLLLAVAIGAAVGGAVVAWVGVTGVFVPQDLAFMGVTAAGLDAVDPRLVPLMAHDRVGFGGGVLTTGLVAALCVWCAGTPRSLREALGLAGTLGFGAAIAIHPVVGYDDLVHVGPAVVAALLLALGLGVSTVATRLGTPGARRVLKW